jgi:hypothetical protein
MRKHTVDMTLSFDGKKPISVFNPEDMEEMVKSKGEKYTGLVISPPLFREQDTPDGNIERHLLLKAQVFSGIPKRLPQNGLEKAIGGFYTPSPAAASSLGKPQRKLQASNRPSMSSTRNRGSRPASSRTPSEY